MPVLIDLAQAKVPQARRTVGSWAEGVDRVPDLAGAGRPCRCSTSWTRPRPWETTGHGAHVGATRELGALATEIVRTVRVMDARNRQRFADQEQLLGSWISASKVLGTPPRSGAQPEGGTPAGGEVRPAA